MEFSFGNLVLVGKQRWHLAPMSFLLNCPVACRRKCALTGVAALLKFIVSCNVLVLHFVPLSRLLDLSLVLAPTLCMVSHHLFK